MNTGSGNGVAIGRRGFLGLGAAAAASVFMPVLKADIYADAPDAVLRTPTSANYVITHQTVTKDSVLNLRSAPGGGWAIAFKAK